MKNTTTKTNTGIMKLTDIEIRTAAGGAGNYPIEDIRPGDKFRLNESKPFDEVMVLTVSKDFICVVPLSGYYNSAYYSPEYLSALIVEKIG